MAAPESEKEVRSKPFQWGFLSSSAVILFAIVVGETVGRLVDRYWQAARFGIQEGGGGFGTVTGFFRGLSEYVGREGFGGREFILLGFFFFTALFLFSQRSGVHRFLRSMSTGVSLVVISTVAIAVGVLVPQIENFEDPQERITPANYEQEYDKFRWAEGYFLYHLTHLYGMGMPSEPLSKAQLEGLERYGARYGEEERSNSEKRMLAAISGREKTAEIRAFIGEHEEGLRKFFDVATALSLNRTYKSYWFLTLMGILFWAVFFNTFKGSARKWFTIQKSGFFLVHTGMMILLIGGGISKAFTVRGILNLDLRRPPEDRFYAYFNPNKDYLLPFKVRLDHFARKEWKAVEVHFLDEEFKSRVPRYTLWQDRLIELDYTDPAEGEPQPQLALRVLGMHDRAVVGEPVLQETYDEAEPDVVLPIVELEVSGADHAHPEGVEHDHSADRESVLLSPAIGTQMRYDADMRHRLRIAYGDLDVPGLFPEAADEILGHLEIEFAGAASVAPQVVPFRLGETVETLGGYRLFVQRATKNFKLDQGSEVRDERPLAEQPPYRPAAWLLITPPDGSEPETRPIFDGLDPVDMGFVGSYRHRDLIVRLRWDHWNSPGPARYVLHYGPDASPELYGEDGSRTRVVIDRALELPGSVVVPRALYHRADLLHQEIEFLPPSEGVDGWEADFYSRDARGVELEIVRYPGTENEVRETTRLATTQNASVWYSEDKKVAVVFMENTEVLPFEWRSVLSMIEIDGDGREYAADMGPEKAREIRVNDYLTYRGYRFFQTNADANMPTYSGIGVVYDPGIRWVLFGMYTIIAGATVAFIIRPIVLARRKARAA